jgi:hypothetical protein
MQEFLKNRQELSQKMAEWRQQNPKAISDPKAMAQFQKDNADLIKRQRELAQKISAQHSQQPMPVPPPVNIPPNASADLKALLTARNELMRDQIAFMNEHQKDDPATRQAAMQKWRQDNASRFAQLQQLTQNLSHPATPVPTSTSTTITK